MNYRQVTGWFVLALIVVIAIYDIWVMSVGGKEASISQVLIDYAYEYPSFPFAMGFVCGHIFWRMPERKRKD